MYYGLKQYVDDYVGRNYPRHRDADIVPSYTALLEHMMMEHGQVWHPGMDMEQTIRGFCQGKRFLEVGCRSGGFLKFLLDHGAEAVAGNTGSHHLDHAKRLLADEIEKGKAVIIRGDAQTIHRQDPLRDFDPHYIVSLNLFDRSRWGRKAPFMKIMNNIAKLSTPDTKIYVAPSIDHESALENSDFERVRRIMTVFHSTTHANKGQKNWRNETYRFRVRGMRPRTDKRRLKQESRAAKKEKRKGQKRGRRGTRIPKSKRRKPKK